MYTGKSSETFFAENKKDRRALAGYDQAEILYDHMKSPIFIRLYMKGGEMLFIDDPSRIERMVQDIGRLNRNNHNHRRKL